VSQKRRTFLGTLGAASAAAFARRDVFAFAPVDSLKGRTYDVAVIGAGVFGAWTAWHLRQAGRTVLLVDKYGPASARASSGGESRAIRLSYGPDEIYTRLAHRSLGQWRALFAKVSRPELFQQTGVLWLAKGDLPSPRASLATLKRLGLPHEHLQEDDLRRRYPQMVVPDGGWAILEPESGALLARRAVHAVVADAVASGVDYATADVRPPQGGSRLSELLTASGEVVRAGAYVFACGPWLGQVTPRALEGRIFPTRQQIFFFGVPAGDRRFAPPALPTWIDFDQEIYGMPDLEGRGFKASDDSHGDPFDPDRGERLVTAEATAKVRALLARRFPALKDAPIVETRVCQYENTSNGDFVVDRHPGFDNVWLAGGGSGHGFKHGPAVGEFAKERVLKGDAPEPRFALAGKEKAQKRAVH